MFVQEQSFPQTAPTDDAYSSTGTGLERTGSLGWTKEANGRD